MPSLSVNLILMLGVFAVSCSALFIKMADAPAGMVAFYRMAFSTLLFLPFILGEPLVIKRKEFFLLLLSGLCLALHFLFWIHSFDYTTVATSVFLVATQPIWVVVISFCILKEPVKKPILLGILLALLGSLFIGTSALSLEGSPLGSILALLGALMAAFYLLIGRCLRKNIKLSVYVTFVYGFSSLFLLLYNLVVQTPFLGYTKTTWLSLILLALLPTGVGHTIFNWALEHVPTSFVSLCILGEPLGATLLALLFLREIPSSSTLFGGSFILLGILIAAKTNQSKEENP